MTKKAAVKIGLYDLVALGGSGCEHGMGHDEAMLVEETTAVEDLQ